jgi:hypothetical protein
MRIRINGLPQAGELDELDLRRFRVGEIYDVPPQLGSLLVVAGYAEMVGEREGKDRRQKSRNEAGRFVLPSAPGAFCLLLLLLDAQLLQHGRHVLG